MKLALSIFFIYKQMGVPPDKRYDAFFASLFSDKLTIDANVKILTWNYDNQMELSFAGFHSSKPNLQTCRTLMNAHSKFYNAANKDDFSIFKINGDTSFRNANGDPYDWPVEFQKPLDKGSLYNVIGIFEEARQEALLPNLSFAWEKSAQSDHFLNNTRQAVRNASILVIIGYSFPFFNREIDRAIIRSMNLKKVYIQNPNASDIIERFDAIVNNQSLKPVARFDKDQFFIPNEL